MAEGQTLDGILGDVAQYFIDCRVNAAKGSAGERRFTIFIDAMHEARKRLKEQEQEISRLKHHVDCDAAEKLPSGCVGYGRGFNDDEPCETCKQCPAYNGYGEE